jgi:hypothetical protein
MIHAALTGRKEATCGGDTESSCCSGDSGKETDSDTRSGKSGNIKRNSNDSGGDASCC